MDSIFNPALFEVADTAGENLELSLEYDGFTVLATPKKEVQYGDHVIPAQEPDWREVFKTGKALLERSRDLNILAKVSRAALHQHGIPGLAEGLSLMAFWLGNQWDLLYPELNVEGVYDPIFRCNAVAELATLLNDFRQAAFLETPFGAVPVSVAETLLNGKPLADQASVSSIEQLSRMLRAEKDRNQECFQAVASIHSSLGTITSKFKAQLVSEFWPDLGPLPELVEHLVRFINENLQEAETPVSVSSNTAASGDAGASPAAAAALPAILNSRSDAIRALALARSYFEKYERSHPAPLLIKRIERLVDLDFFALIKDLTPSGLSEFENLTGFSADEDNSENNYND
jgi:type VI secretion system protein ImpA